MRVRIIGGALGAAFAGMLALAPVAAAQPQQEGLVNVLVQDVVLQVPIGVAANVCGVDAAVLATQEEDAPVTCGDATVNQFPVAFRTPVAAG